MAARKNLDGLVERRTVRQFAWATLCAILFTIPVIARAADSLVETPLNSLSGPRGTTMFKTLASEETGIVTENRYADPSMWAERYAEFAVGAVGTGVAIGDYDGDGRPDLFVVSK